MIPDRDNVGSSTGRPAQNRDWSIDLESKMRIVFLVYLCLVVFVPGSVLAQEAANMAIEGYVLNAKNGRPIPNAFVGYQANYADGGSSVIGAPTDSNGFYQIEFLVTHPVSSALFVTCRTRRKGDLRFDTQIYPTLRTEVYRRDFHIALPRHVSSCD